MNVLNMGLKCPFSEGSSPDYAPAVSFE
jgi:hypothetical protein